MKPSHLYVSVLATASLAFAGTAQAQSDRSSSNMDRPMDSIMRVSKDSVDQRVTARDLIGSAVYDRAGERIGNISDIDLHETVPGTLASAFIAAQANRPMTTPAIPGAATTDRTADRTSRDAAGSARRAASDADKKAHGKAHGTVYLSVGGLWGIGDDLVSLSLSQLNYNAAEERFEISANKADVVALAKGEISEGYAAGAPMSDTAAGKQSFADEAVRVQESLEADPQTSAFAANVVVTTDGENLELRGTLDNKEQQKRILDAARRATALDVKDKTETRR